MLISRGREELLQEWLQHKDKEELFHWSLLAGDASFRRYYRVRSEDGLKRYVVMDVPPPEATEPFYSIAQAYQEAGLRVPQIRAVDHRQGIMLVEDLGNCLLLQSQTSECKLYQGAIQLLPQVMSIRFSAQGALPCYDHALLQQENDLFIEWLLGKHLGLKLTAEEQKMWADVNKRLIDNALAQPQVGVHRDYHSRNIMVLPTHSSQPELALIDFQDAVIGPVTYDLVSLLKDCYHVMAIQQRQELLEYAFALFGQKGWLTQDHTFAEFLYWFDWMGVQRHIKASGIFARLYHRDGKSQYMADIPRTLAYIVELGKTYPELQGLAALMTEKVFPALALKAETLQKQ